MKKRKILAEFVKSESIYCYKTATKGWKGNKNLIKEVRSKISKALKAK